MSSPPSFTVLDQSPSTQTLSEHKLPTTPGPARCPHAAQLPEWTHKGKLVQKPKENCCLGTATVSEASEPKLKLKV